ncbi:unnamed protein product [Fraxinus pennsylvanica]|uniref:Uncharacterized protein n=1 Tax=Fraxinus pennsylvanica TaxID=56036 RepID=A0AAD2A9H5_9LAMI|nr:unnamed protein product [Fraxinus pennsylvanica]
MHRFLSDVVSYTLLDAAVHCRSSQKANSEDRSLLFHALETSHNVSDAVAEATLLCLEELLKKCHLGAVDQKANSEDRSLLFHDLETSHNVSDAVAEATLLCLEELLKKCHSGSVDQVGSADALAFYLLGVVSQIRKVLNVSQTMISGVSGRTEALDHAIRGFAEYLVIVLEDDVNISSLGIIVNDNFGLSSSEEQPLASLLEELHHLPVKDQGKDEITAQDLTKSVDRGVTMSGFREKARGDFDRKVGSLRVKRTTEWIVNTSTHVLLATFPHVGYLSCDTPYSTGTLIKMQLHTEGKHIDAFGELATKTCNLRN